MLHLCPMGKPSSLRIIPLGGVGEIGRNMTVYEYENQILIVDAGLMFPENDMLGIDYLIPDFSYIQERRDRVVGIVITHGHEDHIGAIHHLLDEIDAPVYATQMTRGLIEVKLARHGHGLLQKTNLQTVQAGKSKQIGPFNVEFFHMSHSIPDGVGLGIQSPAGLVVHTGDFKFDMTPVDNWTSDFAKLAEFSHRDVLALLADSTNAERQGWTPSERKVDEALEQVFNQAPGRIIIASFASHISRIQQVANATARHDRKLAIAGSSMIDNVKITRKLGYLDILDSLLVPIDQALTMKSHKVTIMCTGTQGESASILGRLSTGTNRIFDIKSGDTVVLSSQVIPGNEESVYRTINYLFQRGANVIYEDIAPVHVSGHASQEEIKLLLNLVRPRYFIPIHGEQRHLRQSARLAMQVGIPKENVVVTDNGQVIEFRKDKIRLAERMPYTNLFVDGSVVGDISPDVMHEREVISRDGIVIVGLVLDETGELYNEAIAVTSWGFIAAPEAEEILGQVRQRIAEVIKTSQGDLEEDVVREVRAVIYRATRRRPRVFVTINRV